MLIAGCVAIKTQIMKLETGKDKILKDKQYQFPTLWKLSNGDELNDIFFLLIPGTAYRNGIKKRNIGSPTSTHFTILVFTSW